MIKGTGIDITLISRMEKSIKNDAFMKRVFTGHEREYINSKGQKAQTAAGIFCTKEALLKAFSKGIGDIPLKDIEVRHSKNGSPYVVFDCAEKIHASISHMGDIAIAQVIIESED